MKIFQVLIQLMQLGLAGMIVAYLVIQYQARHTGSEVVRRLRKHIAWETTALLVAFVTSIFVSHDGYGGTVVTQIIALAVTVFLFFTFLAGSKMFWEIKSGKYDDQLK